MKKFYIILALVFITACATEAKYENNLNSMVGFNKRDLIDAWGPPAKTYKLDNKTEYLTYETSTSSYVPGTSRTSLLGDTAYTNYNNGYMMNYTCSTTFTLENGIVSSWRHSGNNCVAQ